MVVVVQVALVDTTMVAVGDTARAITKVVAAGVVAAMEETAMTTDMVSLWLGLTTSLLTILNFSSDDWVHFHISIHRKLWRWQ